MYVRTLPGLRFLAECQYVQEGVHLLAGLLTVCLGADCQRSSPLPPSLECREVVVRFAGCLSGFPGGPGSKLDCFGHRLAQCAAARVCSGSPPGLVPKSQGRPWSIPHGNHKLLSKPMYIIGYKCFSN